MAIKYCGPTHRYDVWPRVWSEALELLLRRSVPPPVSVWYMHFAVLYYYDRTSKHAVFVFKLRTFRSKILKLGLQYWIIIVYLYFFNLNTKEWLVGQLWLASCNGIRIFSGKKKKKDIFFQIKTEFNIKLHPYSNYIIVLCLHILKEFILFWPL